MQITIYMKMVLLNTGFFIGVKNLLSAPLFFAFLISTIHLSKVKLSNIYLTLVVNLQMMHKYTSCKLI